MIALLPRRPPGGFVTVVADPPWPYADRLPGKKRGAAEHYALMSVGDICALGDLLRPKLAEEAHLYLWTTNAFMREAYDVVRAWGFERKTVLTWVKARRVALAGTAIQTEADPRIQIGMGWHFRNCTEHVLFAVRGKLRTRERWRPGVFFAPREQHSAKPEVFYEMMEAMSPGPRLELFARAQRPGWSVWGREAQARVGGAEMVAVGLPEDTEPEWEE